MPELQMVQATISYRVSLDPADTRAIMEAEGYAGGKKAWIPWEDRIEHKLETLNGVESSDHMGDEIYVAITANQDTPELRKRVLFMIGEYLVQCRHKALAMARRSRSLARRLREGEAMPHSVPRPMPHAWRGDPLDR